MPTINTAVHSSKNQILKFIGNLNAYTAAHEDTPEIHRNQILATRVYFVLLALCMLVLVQYTALSRQTINGKMANPSLIDYERLAMIYPDTLSCSCSQIAVSTGLFITIETAFHQVCCTKSISVEYLESHVVIWKILKKKSFFKV